MQEDKYRDEYKITTHLDTFMLLIANQCSRPTLENGRFEDDKQLYDAGETVDFYCDEGFNLVGAQRITCQATSEWSDDFPSCDRKLRKNRIFFCVTINRNIVDCIFELNLQQIFV